MLLLCCHSVDYNLKNLTKGGAYYSGGTDFGFSEGSAYAESKVTETGLLQWVDFLQAAYIC